MKKKLHTLQGHYAGFTSRFFAFVIDLVVVMVMISLTSYSLSLVWRFFALLPNPAIELFVSNAELTHVQQVARPYIIPAINIILIYGYFVFFWMTSGQTLGKAFMGVRVVSISGRPLTFMQAFFRFLVYPISGLVFFLGFLWILIDNQRQGWHDTIARTYVIYSWKAVPHAGFLRQWQGKKTAD
jgi:uncharacterized RDD family membrane protein YckC